MIGNAANQINDIYEKADKSPRRGGANKLDISPPHTPQVEQRMVFDQDEDLPVQASNPPPESESKKYKKKLDEQRS